MYCRYLILAELMISFYSTKILHHPHQMGHLVKHKKTAQQLNILTLKINILFGGPQFMQLLSQISTYDIPIHHDKCSTRTWH